MTGRVGAFSYSHSQLTDDLAFFKAFEIEFKDEYLFEWIDD